MSKNQLKVEVILDDEFLKKNELIKNYNKKDKTLIIDLDGNVPKEMSDELSKFLNTDEVNQKQIALFNPLLKAVNDLQELKNSKYEPELSEDLEKEIIDKCQLEHLSIEVDSGKYLFDFKSSVYESVNSDESKMNEIKEKTEKFIQTTLVKQHKASHQVYKDAKKIIGSFNSSLTSSKKTLKQPFVDANKKIDNLYKLFKNESDLTKNALNSNFSECLKKEEEKKKLDDEKKKKDELEKISQLSEENKEQQNIIDKQKREQVFNSVELGVLGNLSKKLAGSALQLNKQGLNEQKDYLSKISYEDIVKDVDSSILNEEQIKKLKESLESNRKYWMNIIDREIKLREEKEVSDANKAKLEVLDKQVPKYPEMVPDGVPFQEVNDTPVQFEEISISEDDKMMEFIKIVKQAGECFDRCSEFLSSNEFKEGFYANMNSTLLEKSLPKIKDFIVKTSEWSERNVTNYINHKNNNQ